MAESKEREVEMAESRDVGREHNRFSGESPFPTTGEREAFPSRDAESRGSVPTAYRVAGGRENFLSLP